MILCLVVSFLFSAGIPCIAAVGIQCPSDFNHETKAVFNATSLYYGFLGVFKTGKLLSCSCLFI